MNTLCYHHERVLLRTLLLLALASPGVMADPPSSNIPPVAPPATETPVAAPLVTAPPPGVVPPVVAPALTPANTIRLEAGPARDVVQQVRTARAGTVVAVFVKPGDHVVKDQVLGHLELGPARLALDTARASLEGTGTLDQMYWQHQAAIANRQETEDAARRRLVTKTKLQYALSMENYAQGQYQAQRDLKNVQRINFEHCRREYDNCFFRAPIDGTIKEVKALLGQPVGIAAHVFTIGNDAQVEVVVTVPAACAEGAARVGRIPMRSMSGGPTLWADVAGVDGVADESTPDRTLRLFLDKSDLASSTPTAANPKSGFEVMVPKG